MDAHVVFTFWRRVLRDQQLQQKLLAPDGLMHIANLALTDQERDVATAIWHNRATAYWPCEGFRYRSVSTSGSALRMYAPATSK